MKVCYQIGKLFLFVCLFCKDHFVKENRRNIYESFFGGLKMAYLKY